MLKICFPSVSLEFQWPRHMSTMCQEDWSSIKHWGPRLGWMFLVDISHMFHGSLLAGLIASCQLPGRGLVETYDWFPPDFTLSAFLFANFALYSFTGIKHSHEYTHMLSPMSLSSESSNLGNGLGDHWHNLPEGELNCLNLSQHLCLLKVFFRMPEKTPFSSSKTMKI